MSDPNASWTAEGAGLISALTAERDALLATMATIVGGVLHRLDDPTVQVAHPYSTPFTGPGAEMARDRLLTIGLDIRPSHSVHVEHRGTW